MRKYLILLILASITQSVKSQSSLILPDSTVSYGTHSIVDLHEAKLDIMTKEGSEAKINFYTNYSFPNKSLFPFNSGSITSFGSNWPQNFRTSGIRYDAERHRLIGTQLQVNGNLVEVDINGRMNSISFITKNSGGVALFDSWVRLGVERESPAIKLKKITAGCTTSANSGYPSGEVSVPHGLTASKIISAEVLVEYSPNYFVKAGNDLFGYQFDITIAPSDILIRNATGSASSEIRSKSCKILLTYEQ